MSETTEFMARVRRLQHQAPRWAKQLLDTRLNRPEPQPQQVVPAQHPPQAPAAPDAAGHLAALDAAPAAARDDHAFQTALTELSQIERQAYWQTQPAAANGSAKAMWEQRTDAVLARYKTDPALAAGLAFLRRTLRQHPHEPVETVEVSANALHRTFMDEGGGDVARFAKQVASANTRAEIAANQDLIVQLAGMFGQQTATRVLPYIDRLKAEQAERARASVLGTDLDTGEEVSITQRERPQGQYIIGVNGTGKSVLMANLIKKDLELGHGLCLIEPHGDLTRTVLSMVPPHRLPEVILLDVMDSATFPFGLNLFQSALAGDPHEDAKTASFLMHLFEKVWNVGTETPRLQQVLRNVTRTLLANPGMTFAEIPLLLWDDTAREKLVGNVTNTQTRLFWQQYNRRSPRERSELTDSTMNKVDAYLNEPMIANIVSQAQTTINFRRIMDEGKILLIQLSPQLEEMSRLLGAVVIGRLLMAAFSRTDQPERERRQFNLYVDELQRFATSDWRTFLEEARKFKVAITMAHQSITQLDESLQTAAMGAGTIVVFRVSGEDARVLARSFDATPTQEQTGVEPIRAPVTDVVSHLVRRGHTHARVSTFVAEYLMPLETTLQKVRGASRPFQWGCTLLRTHQVIEARRLVNDVLFQCMQAGRADGFIPPLALFVLGGAADDGITQVFYDDIKRNLLSSGPECLGFYQSADRFGEAAFLADQQAVDDLLKQHAKKRVWDDIFLSRMVYPGPAFLRMLRSLREVMAILAREPILVDTGQYQPVYRQRTYTDMQAQIANDLSQQANYLARVKLLQGEHTIGTRPLPPLLSEAQVNERIRQIKQRMQALGYCKSAQEVEAEVRLRHERLRERNTTPPPTHTPGTNRRRYRPRPPARDAS